MTDAQTQQAAQSDMIVILRDPVERAHSNWAHLWSAGLEPYADFLRACDEADDAAPRGRAAARPGLIEPLTERELEVLRLLAAGRSNQRIAHELVVALDTVKKHVTHILGKLGAANRTEAAVRARQVGLIP